MTHSSVRAVAPSFDLISEVDAGGLKVAVVRAAMELALFDHIDAGHVHVPGLAEAAGATEQGMTLLVRALLSLDLLELRDGGALACTPVADAYLRHGAASSFAPILLSWFRNRDHLVDAVRGAAVAANHADGSAADLWRSYAAPDLLRWPDIVGPLGQKLRERGVGVPPGGSVLDLGAGSALTSLTLVSAVPTATAVAVDRAEVLSVAEAVACDMGVGAQLRCVPGDVRTFPMGEAAYDVILLGNVAQYLTDDELLDVLSRANRALRPGGVLQVVTPVIDEGSAGLEANWSTAVEMFLSSPEVELRDDRVLRNMLAAVGFTAVRRWHPHLYVASVASA
jgi:ubiquinone/menaquinone biosynthesis C-methylase UbiE